MGKINLKMPNDEILEFETGIPIIVLGANGSGKTRFSIRIEELNDSAFNRQSTSKQPVHRISAQKLLNINKSIVVNGLESAESSAYIGSSDANAFKFHNRYGSEPVTNVLNDYNSILSLLFAKNNRILEEQHLNDKQLESSGAALSKRVQTPIELVKEVWDYILPYRELDLTGNEVHVKRSSRYHGREMSDGERVILYMITQIITAKENCLLIIDEPELHIHKAVLSKLWSRLEEVRQDCIFMYLTHDLDFAATRTTDKVIWIKDYLGNNAWDFEYIDINDFDNIPPSLIYELIGTQKKVILVEGTKDSLDFKIYNELYSRKGCHIIPCGSCDQVINFVMAKKVYDRFNSIELFGIIDRDFRSDNEINDLASRNIYCLNVAEVENLFIVPEVLNYIANYLRLDVKKVDEVQNFIKSEYVKQIEDQIKKSMHSEIIFQLSIISFNRGMSTSKQITEHIKNTITEDFVESIIIKLNEKFREDLNIDEILKIFNFKSLSVRVGNFFGLSDKNYSTTVINLLMKNKDMAECFEKYLPEIAFLS